jgi:hypothetical protein
LCLHDYQRISVTPNIVNSVTVCEGASYTWPQNGLSYTADESPVVLNLTDDNGCAYTATLTINEYPVTPNIVNSVTVCEGASYLATKRFELYVSGGIEHR